MFNKAILFTSRRVGLSRHFSAVAQPASGLYQPAIEDIKKLRAASEAPVKDCKKALVEANGDFPAAFEWLRKKGIASATAKAGRNAGEGLVAVHCDGKSVGMVEINCETDFVALNERFQQLVQDVAAGIQSSTHIESGQDVDASLLGQLPLDESKTLTDLVPELIGKVGENVVPRRGTALRVNNGLICTYVHNTVKPGLGKAAAIVALESSTPMTDEVLESLIEPIGRRIAMHVVAAKPKYMSRESVPEDVVNQERKMLMEQAAGSGKPAHILEKMIDGRLNKYFAEIVLLDQDHLVEDGNPKVKKVLDDVNKAHGLDISMSGYARYQVGEIESV